jgi:hypothetical protein
MDEDLKLVVVVFIIFLLARLVLKPNRDYLQARPHDAERERMVRTIIKHEPAFKNGKLKDLSYKMPWLDAITYEDIRHLIRANEFNSKKN